MHYGSAAERRTNAGCIPVCERRRQHSSFLFDTFSVYFFLFSCRLSFESDGFMFIELLNLCQLQLMSLKRMVKVHVRSEPWLFGPEALWFSGFLRDTKRLHGWLLETRDQRSAHVKVKPGMLNVSSMKFPCHRTNCSKSVSGTFSRFIHVRHLFSFLFVIWS